MREEEEEEEEEEGENIFTVICKAKQSKQEELVFRHHTLFAAFCFTYMQFYF